MNDTFSDTCYVLYFICKYDSLKQATWIHPAVKLSVQSKWPECVVTVYELLIPCAS